MAEEKDRNLIPEQVRRVLSLALTIIAALLYVGIMGSVIRQSILSENPTFPDNMARAAGLLSGLVGSVVTAGFARSQRPVSVQMSATHPMGGRALTAWRTLKPPSLVKRNLLGLADTLGLPVPQDSLSRSTAPSAEEPQKDEPLSAVIWVALLYFAVYFLVGASAFMITIWKEGVPEILVNSGWVWLGTVMSSTYSFLGLNTSN